MLLAPGGLGHGPAQARDLLKGTPSPMLTALIAAALSRPPGGLAGRRPPRPRRSRSSPVSRPTAPSPARSWATRGRSPRSPRATRTPTSSSPSPASWPCCGTPTCSSPPGSTSSSGCRRCSTGRATARSPRAGPGYVTAYTGIHLLEVPTSLSRSEGDIHVDGNPHIHTDPRERDHHRPEHPRAGSSGSRPRTRPTSPGGSRISRSGCSRPRWAGAGGDPDRRPPPTTCSRATSCYDFLGTSRSTRASRCSDRLGGWLKESAGVPRQGDGLLPQGMGLLQQPLQGDLRRVHRGQARHPADAGARAGSDRPHEAAEDPRALRVELFRSEPDPARWRERTGAQAVIVPENTDGAPGVNTYFDLMNTWVSGLAAGIQAEERPDGSQPVSAAAGGVPRHRGDPFVPRPPRHRARGDLRGPVAGPDGGAGLGGGDPGRQPAGLARPRFLYALGFTTHRRGGLRPHPHRGARAGCRRRRSSASSTSSPRRPRSWWPTAPRAAARRSRTSWSGSLLWVSWPAIARLAGDLRRDRGLPLGPPAPLPHDLLRAGDRARQRLEHPLVGFPVLPLVRDRDHVLGADRRRTAGLLLPGGAGGRRLPVHPPAGRAGRRSSWVAGALASAGGLLDLVPLRPADRTGDRLHVRGGVCSPPTDCAGRSAGCRRRRSSRCRNRGSLDALPRREGRRLRAGAPASSPAGRAGEAWRPGGAARDGARARRPGAEPGRYARGSGRRAGRRS